VAQLELDQARHRLERFRRIVRLPGRRIVEQRQRRQLLGSRSLEERHLTLLLDTLALLHLLHDRLDLWRRALGDALLFLADGFTARLLEHARRLELSLGGNLLPDPIERVQRRTTDAVHDLDPRDPHIQRHAGQPKRQQQQRRAKKAQRRYQAFADERTEHTASRAGIALDSEVQARKPAARRQREQETETAKRERGSRGYIDFAPVAINQPSCQRDHDGKQKGWRAEQEHEQPRYVRAEWADDIGQRTGLAGGRERRIVAIVCGERGKDDQRKRAEYPQCTFAQGAHDGSTELRPTLQFSSARQWILPQL